MPKILLYITSKVTWIFLFFGTDVNEKRAHVHVGKKSTEEYCKIWLEPEVLAVKSGTLTSSELSEALKITREHHALLMEQWKKFTDGKTIKMITIKK
jgi:hypothetical protein